MVVIYVSTTHPVNPPEKASDILTHDELWAALVAKARHPEEFVAAIEASRIVREDATGLTRAVLFKGELGKGGEVEEEIKYFGKMKVGFLSSFLLLYLFISASPSIDVKRRRISCHVTIVKEERTRGN